MNQETDFSYGGEMRNIISGIIDLSRDTSNDAQKIDTAMIELDTIKRHYNGEDISKGKYDINGRPGTIYDRYTSDILKNLLNIKTEFWNPNWDFVTWEELYSKIDKINSILEKIGNQKAELEDILIKSSEIKTKIEAMYKYLPTSG